MTNSNEKFAGRWLHHGDWNGKEFSHEMPEYDHDEGPGGEGSTPMRHALIECDSSKVGVWVPAHWTDQQVREALEANW